MFDDIIHPQTVGDQKIDVATIPTISLAKLTEGDATEADRLQRASSDIGFFYIDLRDLENEALTGLEPLYAVAEKYFHQSKDAKLQDIRHDIKPSQDLGYKYSECDETLELSLDEMLTNKSPLPQILKPQLPTINSFTNSCHQISLTILKSLQPTLLNTHHLPTQPSNTGLKFISEPSLSHLSDVGDWTHTDGGTLTLLFYDAWGLQLLLPSTQRWGYIPAKDGCVVVNVADSLQRLSGGRYHSPKHRITQFEDGAGERLYLSYFLRPAVGVGA